MEQTRGDSQWLQEKLERTTMELRTLQCKIEDKERELVEEIRDKERELVEQQNEIREREKEFTEYRRQKDQKSLSNCKQRT